METFEILYHLNETNETFFPFNFLLHFFWLLFFVKLLICFRIPKILSAA